MEEGDAVGAWPIWEGFLRDEPSAQRLPAILPVVLHDSKDGWTAATAFSDVLDLEPPARSAFAGFVPEFRFLLDDAAQQIAQEAHAEGRIEGRAELVLRLLGLRFGSLPAHVAERLRGGTAEQLELWAERLLSADKLEDVFL